MRLSINWYLCFISFGFIVFMMSQQSRSQNQREFREHGLTGIERKWQ